MSSQEISSLQGIVAQVDDEFPDFCEMYRAAIRIAPLASSQAFLPSDLSEKILRKKKDQIKPSFDGDASSDIISLGDLPLIYHPKAREKKYAFQQPTASHHDDAKLEIQRLRDVLDTVKEMVEEARKIHSEALDSLRQALLSKSGFHYSSSKRPLFH
eukprot:TRINITY_DN7375_c0_g1_i1.p1 TRINITY_DN7375_c0_g1~~TRINITY_DN7375_c0_g1_i1.p1  ORF type:complete len:169 (+),score=53.90 TRINITY_DN7375_c0_g1_i1:38-508(+)